MHTDFYNRLRSTAISLLGPDADPDSEYVRALVELTVSATTTATDDLDDLREDLERDLRLSCEPTAPLWVVTAHLPESTFGFEWRRTEEAARTAFLATLENGRPATRVVLKRTNVPASIAKGDPEGITDWIDSQNDLEAFDELLAVVVA